MKKIFFAPLLAAALACGKTAEPQTTATPRAKDENTKLTISVEDGTVRTKADAFTDVLDHEKILKDLQVAVYDGNGVLEKYQAIEGGSCSMSITQGRKSVFVISGGPSIADIGTKDSLADLVLDLSLCSWTDGLVMRGEASVNCAPNQTSKCNISLERYAARVALTSITPDFANLPGDIVLKGVFLTDAASSIAADGTWTGDFANAGGKNADGETVCYLNGVLPSYSEQTGAAYSDTLSNGSNFLLAAKHSLPFISYCYPNDTDDTTSLVIELAVSGQTYYYPIVLDSAPLKGNCAYTVTLKVTGLGSDDPGKPVQKGTLEGSITISEWATGEIYERTI